MSDQISVADTIFQSYLRKANGETDPWHRTELRNSAYLVKVVLEEFFQITKSEEKEIPHGE